MFQRGRGGERGACRRSVSVVGLIVMVCEGCGRGAMRGLGAIVMERSIGDRAGGNCRRGWLRSGRVGVNPDLRGMDVWAGMSGRAKMSIWAKLKGGRG